MDVDANATAAFDHNVAVGTPRPNELNARPACVVDAELSGIDAFAGTGVDEISGSLLGPVVASVTPFAAINETESAVMRKLWIGACVTKYTAPQGNRIKS